MDKHCCEKYSVPCRRSWAAGTGYSSGHHSAGPVWDVQKARLAQSAQDAELKRVFAFLASAMTPRQSARSSARALAGEGCHPLLPRIVWWQLYTCAVLMPWATRGQCSSAAQGALLLQNITLAECMLCGMMVRIPLLTDRKLCLQSRGAHKEQICPAMRQPRQSESPA